MHARTLLAALAVLFSLVACGPDKVSFDTLETARGTAKSNAEYNGQNFRTSHPQYAGLALEMQGDSSQIPTCPQGDGWASGKLVNTQTGGTIKLKCSNVSSSVGCLTQGDFDTKPYASDDGHCQNTDKVPFLLPKVAK